MKSKAELEGQYFWLSLICGVYGVLSRGGMSSFWIPVWREVCDLMANQWLISDILLILFFLNCFAISCWHIQALCCFAPRSPSKGCKMPHVVPHVVDPGASSHGRFLFSEEVSHFSGASTSSLATQPGLPQSWDLPTHFLHTQGICRQHSHATLFLHSCWMYGSNTADKQTCASGLVTSRDRGSLCKERDGIKSQEMCTVRAVDALSQLVFQPCRKGCASPRSATDPCCSHFFPQSWISAGFRRRRAPAETLCWNGTTTPRPRAVPASGTAAAAATRTGSTRRKNVKNSASLVRGTQPNPWHSPSAAWSWTPGGYLVSLPSISCSKTLFIPSFSTRCHQPRHGDGDGDIEPGAGQHLPLRQRHLCHLLPL